MLIKKARKNYHYPEQCQLSDNRVDYTLILSFTFFHLHSFIYILSFTFFHLHLLQIAKRASVAAAPLAAWVVANVKFSVVLEKIEPLENEQAQLEK